MARHRQAGTPRPERGPSEGARPPRRMPWSLPPEPAPAFGRARPASAHTWGRGARILGQRPWC
eukprot:11127034-Lingulodinium_polyedra.AAC.1